METKEQEKKRESGVERGIEVNNKKKEKNTNNTRRGKGKRKEKKKYSLHIEQ